MTLSVAPPFPVTDNGFPAGLCFDRNHPEVFDPWKDHGTAVLIKVAKFTIGDVPEKADVLSGGSLKWPPQRPAASDPEWPAKLFEGLDCQLDSLVGFERRHDEIVVPRASSSRRLEELRINRRVDDRCIALIDPADASANGFGIRNEMIDCLRTCQIEAAQIGCKQFQAGPLPTAARTKPEIAARLIPQIAHRCVYIADVGNAVWDHNPFGYRMAAADHDVGVPDPKRPHRAREKRQVETIGARR